MLRLQVHTIDTYVPVVSTAPQPKTVAEIRVLLTLEDMGDSDDIPVRHAAVSSSSGDGEGAPMRIGTESDDALGDQPLVAVDRDSPEYKAALELEMWKRVEQDRFRLQLNAKEALLMKVSTRPLCQHGPLFPVSMMAGAWLQALSEEFQQRDKQREEAVRRKQEECEQRAPIYPALLIQNPRAPSAVVYMSLPSSL